MSFLGKFVLVLTAAVFCIGLGTSNVNAQGRYWHHDNGRHLGWYKHGRGRRVRVVTYRSYASCNANRGRRYAAYYPRYYYPRYRYSTISYAPYYVRERYPVYRVYPRSGLSVNLNLRFGRRR